jgi:DNA invertase Pin-like site-specific DNA recombinase
MAVYGYCRVSTLAQVEDGESLAVQRRQIQGRAMQEGWTLDEVFVERAVQVRGRSAIASRAPPCWRGFSPGT